MTRGPVVGITGGVGCGKSEVGRILERIGVAVVDADAVVHRLLRESADVQAAVFRLCGPAVRGADGAPDRAALAARVFADDALRRALEAVLHPLVRAELEAWRAAPGASAGRAALIPLLYEAGFASGWDAVWCVTADDALANARLRAKGWSDARIEALRRAQWPLAEKARRADVVIENNGTLDELEARVIDRWRALEKRRT